jgi:hypothetical protein
MEDPASSSKASQAPRAAASLPRRATPPGPTRPPRRRPAPSPGGPGPGRTNRCTQVVCVRPGRCRPAGNRRPITVFTRRSVQRWSSQPCAAGPLASSAHNWANCCSLSLGSDAGPRGRRASGPPSSHIRRYRCTEQTLTRRSLAIAELASPWANRSAASAVIPRGTTAVRRSASPLVDTACPGDTARATSRQPLQLHEFNLSNLRADNSTLEISSQSHTSLPAWV